MKCNILISTFSTLDEAKEISHSAIQEKFAACANILPVNSIYSWKNSIESSDEFLVKPVKKRSVAESVGELRQSF